MPISASTALCAPSAPIRPPRRFRWFDVRFRVTPSKTDTDRLSSRLREDVGLLPDGPHSPGSLEKWDVPGWWG